MKLLPLLIFLALASYSSAMDLIDAEWMNFSGALHAVSSNDYQQFLRFGTSELKTKISEKEFNNLCEEFGSKIKEGYATEILKQEWDDESLFIHFIVIKFRSKDHKKYSSILIELKTVPTGTKSEKTEGLGKISNLIIKHRSSIS